MKREHIVELTPAFDKRDPDPKKNYGIGCVILRMVVKGPEGAVQFVLHTGWNLDHVEKELETRIRGANAPLPADLGYHSPKPMHEGQYSMGATVIHYDEKIEMGPEDNRIEVPKITYDGEPTLCEYVGNKPCYYDGSSLAADNVYQILLKAGSDGVWAYLEEYYEETFLGKTEEEST